MHGAINTELYIKLFQEREENKQLEDKIKRANRNFRLKQGPGKLALQGTADWTKKHSTAQDNMMLLVAAHTAMPMVLHLKP